jgi:hypothetical protein
VRRPLTAGSASKRPPPGVGDPAVNGLLTSGQGILKNYRSGFMGSIVWSIIEHRNNMEEHSEEHGCNVEEHSEELGKKNLSVQKKNLSIGKRTT